MKSATLLLLRVTALVVSFAAIFSLATSLPTQARDIAVCGASVGYGYYALAGLARENPKRGKWTDDVISDGRITLVAKANQELDLLIADASGAVFSTVGDGGSVILVGRSDEMLAVIAVDPRGSVETYTFLNSANGPEVIWSSNKFGALILKIAAYRAPRQFVDLRE